MPSLVDRLIGFGRRPKLFDQMRSLALAPLQPTDRANVLPLGQALHPLSQGASPLRDGRDGNQRLFDAPGGQREDRRLHTEPSTFRHSLATQLLESGYDIRTIQDLLVHKDVKTNMIYSHVLNKGGKGVKSPVDDLSRRSEVFYTETIYPLASIRKHGIIVYKYWRYDRITGEVLCRDVAA